MVTGASMRLVSAVPTIASRAILKDAEEAELVWCSRSFVPEKRCTQRLDSGNGRSWLLEKTGGEDVRSTMRRYSTTAPGKLIFIFGLARNAQKDLGRLQIIQEECLYTGVPSELPTGELGLVL